MPRRGGHPNGKSQLDSLLFGMDISDEIVAPLPSTKYVFIHEGGLD